MGAAVPIEADEGSTPTRKVDRPMIRIETTKAYLRPTMSPRRPNTRAPKGRTAKPAAKVSRAKMKPAVGFRREKKCWAMTAAREPETEKSYDSKTVAI